MLFPPLLLLPPPLLVLVLPLVLLLVLFSPVLLLPLLLLLLFPLLLSCGQYFSIFWESARNFPASELSAWVSFFSASLASWSRSSANLSPAVFNPLLEASLTSLRNRPAKSLSAFATFEFKPADPVAPDRALDSLWPSALILVQTLAVEAPPLPHAVAERPAVSTNADRTVTDLIGMAPFISR